MGSLFDFNVLMALHDQQHVHHRTATKWFRQHAPEGWASCPLTQNGAVRVISAPRPTTGVARPPRGQENSGAAIRFLESQPAYPLPAPLSALLTMFRRSFGDPSHACWHDDVSLADQKVFENERIHGHRQITDVYLLRLAVAHGGRLVTLDARIPLSAVHESR